MRITSGIVWSWQLHGACLCDPLPGSLCFGAVLGFLSCQSSQHASLWLLQSVTADVYLYLQTQNLLNQNPWRNTGWLISISGWLIGTCTQGNSGPVCSFPRIALLVSRVCFALSWPFCHFASGTTVARGMPSDTRLPAGIVSCFQVFSGATSSLRVMTSF